MKNQIKPATNEEILNNYKKFCLNCMKTRNGKRCKNYEMIEKNRLYRVDWFLNNNGNVFCERFQKVCVKKVKEHEVFEIIGVN